MVSLNGFFVFIKVNFLKKNSIHLVKCQVRIQIFNFDNQEFKPELDKLKKI